nr:recombinase family protein [Mesorhizobium sp.]
MTGTSRSASATRPSQPRLRCAVYTRKSTEDGLEQEFNSLDAQREACAAYIASQVGLGWKLVPDRYDDGGISGGTLERPALQRLLQDIRDRKIDVVVVYKIDRLTRSLADFAKIVEVFDVAGASFVSVTQQFNTTTSMGRLTLNVLLSFAQFEREVTAERIRDKIAASKKKGMWMGGTVSFGYRVRERKLVVEDAEAAEVQKLFVRYLELGSVPSLARELNDRSGPVGSTMRLIQSDTGQGRRRPSRRIGNGKLYYMLANPIYIGRIRHGAETHPGEHEAIITDATFEAVQARLADHAPRPRGTAVNRDIHLLNGLVFDETGDRLSPIHATKQGKRYRYYVSSRLKDGRANRNDGWRIPAVEIEAIVLNQLKLVLCDTAMLSRWMHEAGYPHGIEAGLTTAAERYRLLTEGSEPHQLREPIAGLVRRIDIATDSISLLVMRSAVVAWLVETTPAGSPTNAGPASGTVDPTSVANATFDGNSDDDRDLHRIDLPLAIRQRGVERRLVIEGQNPSRARLDHTLIDLVARAHIYLDALASGRDRAEIAAHYGVHPEDVSRLLPLAFLSPRIVDAILTGRQPADLTARYLTREIDLPITWKAQEQVLGAEPIYENLRSEPPG